MQSAHSVAPQSSRSKKLSADRCAKTVQTTNLVVGLGEVGKALQEVLGCEGIDVNQNPAKETYTTLHIAFPYSQHFELYVRHYKDRFKADLIVIHSTVPLGTTTKLNAVHSPIRGVHPHLAEGIRTFVKFFGGPRAEEAAQIFKALNIQTYTTDRAENTEALKLWDTTQYGFLIQLEKMITKYCEDHHLDRGIVYTKANETYNEGYTKLNMPQVVRPHLKHVPGPIGGHCVMPNARLISPDTLKIEL